MKIWSLKIFGRETLFLKRDIISVCVTVGLDAEKIDQPSFINSPEGDKAVLTCNSRSMYWYVQHPNKAPELLIQGCDNAVPKGRFLMDVNRKDALTNLSISDSRTEDTAVYYCAVQPTVTQCVCLMVQKQLLSEYAEICGIRRIR
uniref:Ig-like domain-containing protein n=1 Tax=Paramormyrops kingsleyae TaxID=1676925 RepID=A0A3B3QTN5_9TELE